MDGGGSMEMNEDKELDILLAAYLDGELGLEEGRSLFRRIESGDESVQSRLALLRAIREETRVWAKALREEICEVDIWPALEAKLLQQLSAAGRIAQETLRGKAQEKVLQKNIFSRILSVRSRESGQKQFSRGFSWGFAGGFAMAGCASFAAMLLMQAPQGNAGIGSLAGREVLPLTSPHSSGQMYANVSGHIPSNGTTLAQGANVVASVPGSTLPGSSASEALALASVRGESGLAVVSAGKDMGSESFSNGAIYELPADLFAGIRAREKERRILAEAFPDSFSVQLLGASKVAPPGSGIGESEVFARASRERASENPTSVAALGASGDVHGVQPSPMSSPTDVTWVSNSANSREMH